MLLSPLSLSLLYTHAHTHRSFCSNLHNAKIISSACRLRDHTRLYLCHRETYTYSHSSLHILLGPSLSHTHVWGTNTHPQTHIHSHVLESSTTSLSWKRGCITVRGGGGHDYAITSVNCLVMLEHQLWMSHSETGGEWENWRFYFSFISRLVFIKIILCRTMMYTKH